jgi:hypothetical protein
MSTNISQKKKRECLEIRFIEKATENFRMAFQVLISRIDRIENSIKLQGIEILETKFDKDINFILTLFEEVYQEDYKSGRLINESGWRTIGAIWTYSNEKNMVPPWGRSRQSFYNRIYRLMPILIERKLMVFRPLEIRRRGKAEFEYRIDLDSISA